MIVEKSKIAVLAPILSIKTPPKNGSTILGNE